METNVSELNPDMRGKWLVTTQGSTHVWDLDNMTYERRPGSHSRSGGFAHDGVAHKISRVQAWPRCGEQSIVFYDDPSSSELEQFRVSSRIDSIQQLDGV